MKHVYTKNSRYSTNDEYQNLKAIKIRFYAVFVGMLFDWPQRTPLTLEDVAIELGLDKCNQGFIRYQSDYTDNELPYNKNNY